MPSGNLASRYGVIEHQRKEHKDFKCDQCSLAFYTSEKLARHKEAMNHDRKDGSTPKRLRTYDRDDRNCLIRKVSILFFLVGTQLCCN